MLLTVTVPSVSAAAWVVPYPKKKPESGSPPRPRRSDDQGSNIGAALDGSQGCRARGVVRVCGAVKHVVRPSFIAHRSSTTTWSDGDGDVSVGSMPLLFLCVETWPGGGETKQKARKTDGKRRSKQKKGGKKRGLSTACRALFRDWCESVCNVMDVM